MCADFYARAQRSLADKAITQKTALDKIDGEPAEIVYVVQPLYRDPDTDIELAIQDAYHAAGIGRLCVQSVLVKDRNGQPCLVRRVNRTWRPLALLSEVSQNGWQVSLDASLLRRDAARIALMDYVLANDGRHGFSVFLDKESGRILAGDHARCFGDGTPLEECFARQPFGDLHLTEEERHEAMAWSLTIEPLMVEALDRRVGQLAEAVRRRILDSSALQSR